MKHFLVRVTQPNADDPIWWYNHWVGALFVLRDIDRVNGQWLVDIRPIGLIGQDVGNVYPRDGALVAYDDEHPDSYAQIVNPAPPRHWYSPYGGITFPSLGRVTLAPAWGPVPPAHFVALDCSATRGLFEIAFAPIEHVIEGVPGPWVPKR